MAKHLSLGDGVGGDSDHESDDVSDSDSVHDSQVLRFLEEKDPEWLEQLSDEDEIDLRPKIPIEERIRLADEKEQELIRKAKARGMAKIPDDYVPTVEKPPETKEVKIARYNAWCDKIRQIDREKKEWEETCRKAARAEYEKYAKLQKEYRTRDYYWKPDPLYYLHMKELGYSKIAIEKALFYTDNTSVAKAVEYLKKNPNPTELTKEEVMAAGEEFLKKYRRTRPCEQDNTEQASSKEGEMEIEGPDPELLLDDCSVSIKCDDSINEEMKECKVICNKNQVTHTQPQEVSGQIRRGIKRTYSGEEVKSFPTTSTNPGLPLVPIKESVPEYKMIFIVNCSLLMDAITLSLEVGKVVANIAYKVRTVQDGYKKMFDDWIKEGNKMVMYEGNDSDFLKTRFNWASDCGLPTYLGQCSHYRDVKTPSSTVVGIFGEAGQLKKLHLFLKML